MPYFSITCSVRPAMSDASPLPRCWSLGWNQFQYPLGLAARDCSGYATKNPWRPASSFIRVPAAKSLALCVPPCNITSSGAARRAYPAGTNSLLMRVPAALVYESSRNGPGTTDSGRDLDIGGGTLFGSRDNND